MSVAAGETRPFSVFPATVWPVVFLVAVAGGCWAVTVERMRGMDLGPGADLGALGWFVAVWVTMMAAMMLPSLSRMAVASSRAADGEHVRSAARVVLFSAGYLLPWVAFGVVAYGLVEGVRSLHPEFLAWNQAGRYLAGGVILGAGLYELTATKQRCLRHCRDVRLLRPKPGTTGALTTGIEQGCFCIGCSGVMMAALFALGVMSVAWMLLIAGLIAIEKLLPWTAMTIGSTAAALGLLGVAVMVVPDHVPWLTVPVPMSM